MRKFKISEIFAFDFAPAYIKQKQAVLLVFEDSALLRCLRGSSGVGLRQKVCRVNICCSSQEALPKVPYLERRRPIGSTPTPHFPLGGRGPGGWEVGCVHTTLNPHPFISTPSLSPRHRPRHCTVLIRIFINACAVEPSCTPANATMKPHSIVSLGRLRGFATPPARVEHPVPPLGGPASPKT